MKDVAVIKATEFVSVLLDGSTDRADVEECIIYVRYIPYFSHHKTHFPPTKQGGGKSVRLMERRKQIIFSCSLLLKNW